MSQKQFEKATHYYYYYCDKEKQQARHFKTFGTVLEPSHSDNFFWSSPAFGRKILQKSQRARGPTQSKSGPGNNVVCRRNYVWYIFQ